eukprot:CAMPEP_0203949944 /NCGR_PEP_ID=MMETSP0359-20131031/84221_1 /ASSEMBLY_ACC=CAM_ASM_000338 /TAXON_ID=268821 /ORGANISM="Scrippsiella Hangoei, Strain SHTV-5" /LENGTH=615 /DNA_ID=CAMNT_0050882019 /DNA_START=125 /DNA_END=1972 /DNA_ORIENTATION=-
MPLPRSVAESSPGLPSQRRCFSNYCQQTQVERVAAAGFSGAFPSDGLGGLELTVDQLTKELVAMRGELAQLSLSQAQVQSTIFEVKDGMFSLLSGWSDGPAGGDEKVTEEKFTDSYPVSPVSKGAFDKIACTFDGQHATSWDEVHKKIAPIESEGSMWSAPLSKRSNSKGLVLLADPDEEQETMKNMFLDSELEASRSEEHRVSMRSKSRYVVDTLKGLTMQQAEMVLDSMMGAIIFINAILIGIVMDHSDDSIGWIIADSVFSLIFISEICIKVMLHTFVGHFCGRMRASNIFDASLVITDLAQLVMVVLFPGAAKKADALPSASLFRIIRLAKLARLLRLLRSAVFQDLLAMIQGMASGFQTLLWSMVLFFLVVYAVSLLFREFLGRHPQENVFEYFQNVPRSMFTTFRCSFGDCTTAGGMPIFEHVHLAYGASASFFYCVFIFAITIGLFNVISAIFVETTMAAAMQLQHNKKEHRLRDQKLWNTRITTLVRCIMEVSGMLTIDGRMSDAVEQIYGLEVVKTKEGAQALLDLDINSGDHPYLSDLLDPDNGGTIPISEFIDGIRRLRGDPRRSDIVLIDLMIRDIQKQIGEIMCKVDDIHGTVFPDDELPAV